jgi:hypothetical protein
LKNIKNWRLNVGEYSEISKYEGEKGRWREEEKDQRPKSGDCRTARLPDCKTKNIFGVSPGFFSSYKKGGLTLNLLAMMIVLPGGVTTVVLHLITG